MKTRRIDFASSILDITFDGPPSQRLVDFLYQYLPEIDCTAPDAPKAHFTYRLDGDEKSGKLRLFAGDQLECTMEAAEMAVHLINQTCYHLAYHSRDGVMLHAACLSRAGKGILLPGQTGHGKSTLAAWLIRRGFDYLTDELVYIPEGSFDCQALSRPLNLKRSAQPLLQTVFSLAEDTDRIWHSAGVDLIPPELLGGHVLNRTTLHAILFPNFQPQAEFRMQTLSRAHTGLALMQCLINARNLPEHGFPEIIRISRHIPAYRSTYASFDRLPGVLEHIFED